MLHFPRNPKVQKHAIFWGGIVVIAAYYLPNIPPEWRPAYLLVLGYILYLVFRPILAPPSPCLMSRQSQQSLPQEMYYETSQPKPTRIPRSEQDTAQELEDFKTSLLSNVRERNIYLGETYGVENAEDLMFGGTRPPAPSRTQVERNDPFFKNNAKVHYEPPIPYHEF